MIDNDFYSTAREANENAMLCLRKDEATSAKIGQSSICDKRLRRLNDLAIQFAGSGSVQAQAAEYLNRKTIEKRKILSTVHLEIFYLAK